MPKAPPRLPGFRLQNADLGPNRGTVKSTNETGAPDDERRKVAGTLVEARDDGSDIDALSLVTKAPEEVAE